MQLLPLCEWEIRRMVEWVNAFTKKKQKNTKYGPTHALAHRVHHILANGGNEDSLICEFQLKNGDWDCIQAGDIVHHVREMSKILQLHKQGIDPDLIGLHSL